MVLDRAAGPDYLGRLLRVWRGHSGGLAWRRDWWAAVTAALLGAEKAHADNVRLAAHATLAQTIAFVQAVRTEFDALYIFVNINISPAIAQIDVKKPLTSLFVLSEDYFTIYRANATLLGNVDDAEARDAIVRAYLKAQSFIDTIRTNNVLVQEHEQTKEEALSGPAVEAEIRLERLQRTLETFANGVVNTHLEFQAAHTQFDERTQKWLETKGVVFKPSTQVVLPLGIAPPA